MGLGLRGIGGNPASPPFTHGPYIMSEHVTFSSLAVGGTEGDVWFVDGTNGASANDGKSWAKALDTIQAAVTLAGPGDVIYITAKDLTDFTGDPTSYAETIIIPAATSNLSLIGVSRGRTQGGLPQIKPGAGAVAAITVRAPGCLIANIGINGYGSTGGGILLDDDYAAKAAFGTSIIGCHFKECKCHATNGTLGGAIYTTTAGNCWQVRIAGNRFYKCLADIVMRGTTNTVPQDWVIEDNVFSGPAGSVDVNIYTAADGINGLIIRNNDFQCLPAIGSATNARCVRLTGSVGILAHNRFGCTGGQFGDGVSEDAGDIPTTMMMVENYQEDAIITRQSS